MRQPLRIAAVTVAAVAAALLGTPPASAAPFDVLVFSKTAGFRHDSIPAGIEAIRQLGAANDFTVTATEDAGVFTAANLAPYEAVVFLSTTGDVLDEAQQTAFESYVRGGGGFVGVHAAADTEYDWPFYGDARRRVLRVAPGDPAGDRPGGGPRAPGDRAPRRHLAADRRVVQLPDEPAGHRPRARDARRVDVLRRHDGRRPPDRLVQDRGRRPVVLHRPRAHRGVVRRGRRSGRTCWAGSARPRAPSPPTAASRARRRAAAWRRSRSRPSPGCRWSGTPARTAAAGSGTSSPATGSGSPAWTSRAAPGSPRGWPPAGRAATIEVRAGSPSGPVLGTVAVANTGGYGSFTDGLDAADRRDRAAVPRLHRQRRGPVRRRRLRPRRPRPRSRRRPSTRTCTSSTTPGTAARRSPARTGTGSRAATRRRTDVGANYYPTLGAYDSGDSAVRRAAHGVGAAVRRGHDRLQLVGPGLVRGPIAAGVLDAAAAARASRWPGTWSRTPAGRRPSTVADINYLNRPLRRAARRSTGTPAHGNRPAFYVFESLLDRRLVADRAGEGEQHRARADHRHLEGRPLRRHLHLRRDRRRHRARLGERGRVRRGQRPGLGAVGRPRLHRRPRGAGQHHADARPGRTARTYDRSGPTRSTRRPAASPTGCRSPRSTSGTRARTIEPASSTPPAGLGYQTFEGAYGTTGAASETAYLDRTAHWSAELTRRR